MKWGVRRFQNPDGTLTPEGKRDIDLLLLILPLLKKLKKTWLVYRGASLEKNMGYLTRLI